MKKAQGLPLNAIVIAALVLVVLVVLILIFTGRIGNFTTGTQTAIGESCLAMNTQAANRETTRYECKASGDCVGGSMSQVPGNFKDCSIVGKICCQSPKTP